MKQRTALLTIFVVFLFSCSPATPTQESEPFIEAITEAPISQKPTTQEPVATKFPTETPTLIPLVSNFSNAYFVASFDTLDGTEESCDLTSSTWRIDNIHIKIYDVTDYIPDSIDVVLQATGSNGQVMTYTGTAVHLDNHYELSMSFIESDNELSDFNLVALGSGVTYMLAFAETGEQIGSICTIKKERFAPLIGGSSGPNGSSNGCNPGICESPDAMQFVGGGCWIFSDWYYYPPDQSNQTCVDAFEYDACGKFIQKINQVMCQGDT